MFFAGLFASLCATPIWMQSLVAGLVIYAGVSLLSDESKGHALWSAASSAVVIWLMATYYWDGKCTL